MDTVVALRYKSWSWWDNNWLWEKNWMSERRRSLVLPRWGTWVYSQDHMAKKRAPVVRAPVVRSPIAWWSVVSLHRDSLWKTRRGSAFWWRSGGSKSLYALICRFSANIGCPARSRAGLPRKFVRKAEHTPLRVELTVLALRYGCFVAP